MGRDMDDGTHDNGWEGDEPYQLGEWPSEDDATGWVVYALKRLANEVYCTLQHVERGERGEDTSDYVDAAMHLGNVAEGLNETARTLFVELLTDDERIATTMMQMERKLGIPLRVMEGPGGTVIITPDRIDVGRDVDDLLGGGTSD